MACLGLGQAFCLPNTYEAGDQEWRQGACRGEVKSQENDVDIANALRDPNSDLKRHVHCH